MFMFWVNSEGQYLGMWVPQGHEASWGYIPIATDPGDTEAWWDFDGEFWYIPMEVRIRREHEWRDEIWHSVDVALWKSQDGATGAVGTPAQWIAFKNLLRDWPAHPNFPDTAYRPVAPSV